MIDALHPFYFQDIRNYSRGINCGCSIERKQEESSASLIPHFKMLHYCTKYKSELVVRRDEAGCCPTLEISHCVCLCPNECETVWTLRELRW